MELEMSNIHYFFDVRRQSHDNTLQSYADEVY